MDVRKETDAETPSERHMRKDTRILVVIIAALAVAVAAFAAGWALKSWISPVAVAGPSSAGAGSMESTAATAQSQERQILYWTCSMHPQIHASGPGKCPICGMDLIPVYKSQGGEEATGLILSPRAQALAEVETTPVEPRQLDVTVPMVGKIDYDETRMKEVAAWVPGRIDELYVNFTGVSVKRGDKLIYLYSPELRTGEDEYLIALRRLDAAKAVGNADQIAQAQTTLDAVTKKLQLWGLLPEQIEAIAKSGKADDHTTIYAPIGGTVITRDVSEGQYVTMGQRIVTIADLTSVSGAVGRLRERPRVAQGRADGRFHR